MVIDNVGRELAMELESYFDAIFCKKTSLNEQTRSTKLSAKDLACVWQGYTTYEFLEAGDIEEGQLQALLVNVVKYTMCGQQDISILNLGTRTA